MKENSALICTAVIKAIYDNKRKNILDILKPFILYIIDENGSITEENIMEILKKDFYFANLPSSILKRIINKLNKEFIIIKNNCEYSINKRENVSKQIDRFKEILKEGKKEEEEVLKSIKDYFKSKSKHKTTDEIRKILSRFLNENGYILYKDINYHIDTKNNDMYILGKYIEEHIKNDDYILNYLVNIIEGSLLATALYVNAEGDLSNLSKVSVYLDTTLLLRVIGAKLPDDNSSASELMDLLVQQKANIKCYRHTYDEVRNIIEEYGKNIGKLRERTLEGYEIKCYDLDNITIILQELENMFNKRGIKIVDTPIITEKKYKSMISEKELYNRIKEGYKTNVNDKTIYNDVASIRSIMIERNLKKSNKLEECKAIFVTTNEELRTISNELLKEKEKFTVSPSLTDLDMIAILYTKCMSRCMSSEESNIPKNMLIAQARAAVQPSGEMRKKIIKGVEFFNENEIVPSIMSVIYSSTFGSALMENTNGDIDNVDYSSVLKTYEEELERFDKNEIAKTEAELNLKKINTKFERIKSKKYKEVMDKATMLKNSITSLEIIIIVSISISLIYISLFGTNSTNIIIKVVFTIIGIYGAFSLFIPVDFLNIYKNLTKKLNNYVFWKIDNYFLKKYYNFIEDLDKE